MHKQAVSSNIHINNCHDCNKNSFNGLKVKKRYEKMTVSVDITTFLHTIKLNFKSNYCNT